MSERAVILLADDSEDDALLIRQAFQKAFIPSPLYVVTSGEEAIAYLKGEFKYSNRDEYPLPDLLLLDLKMPGTDGFQVLRWIRQTPGLSELRVLVLTSSDHIRDVNEAYTLGANSFMVKPTDFQNFIELSKSIQDYWLLKSKAPETQRPDRAPKASGRDSQSTPKPSV